MAGAAPSVTAQVLMLFSCRETVGEVLPVLKNDMSERCWSTQWWMCANIGMCVFVSYSLGFPALLLHLLRRRRRERLRYRHELMQSFKLPRASKSKNILCVSDVASYIEWHGAWEQLAFLHRLRR